MSIYAQLTGGDSSARVNRFSKLGAILLLLWLLCPVPAATESYATETGDRQFSEPESWVLSQVKLGKEADLKARFGAESPKRRLRAGFLEKLLTVADKNSPLTRQGVQIAHAVIDGPLNLEYAEIDPLLRLTNCVFNDPVKLRKSHFKKELSFNGSTFLNSANFEGIVIDGNVSCNDTIFARECWWCDAKIGEKFYAERAEFRSTEAKADFNALKVGTSAFFNEARFHGPVEFELAQIGREFHASRAEFFNEQQTANFNSMKVEQYAFFLNTRFHGPVDFRIMNIGGQFDAKKAEFIGQEKLVNFSGIKVGNTIFFQEAKFNGPLKFEFAEIGVNFRATGAAFLNTCQTVNLSKLKVGHKAFLDGGIIQCSVDLSYGDFYDLEIQGTQDGKKGEKNGDLLALNLKGTVVRRELKIAKVRIGALNAANLEVKGPTLFNQVEIVTSADFRHSAFQSLTFQQVKFPGQDKKTKIRKVYLSDLTYSSLSIDKPGEADFSQKDYQEIRNLVETSPFNTQTYVQLEAFFKRIGKESWANRVFIRMHDRELSEKMAWWDPRRWLEWFFWGVLAGYGRAPFRIFFVSLSLILLGAFLYDPQHLKAGKPPDDKIYKSMVIRFLLSLDRFLPIDLGLAKYWNPKTTRFFIWLYFNLELILGWILIPIGLASIYSQIK